MQKSSSSFRYELDDIDDESQPEFEERKEVRETSNLDDDPDVQ